MNSVTVYCGNGGDYEYERDRAWWEIWIAQNIPGCWRVSFYTTIGFKVTPHKEANKAIIEFDDPHNATIFALKAPQWIAPQWIDTEYA